MSVHLSSVPLASKFLDILDRNGITTARQIMYMSPADIKKNTNLTYSEINTIKLQTSQEILQKSITCAELYSSENYNTRIPTSCSSIDSVLGGGFRRGTITEIYGESGSGKTQIALQTSAFNWAAGSVYICTEDVFPIKRYEQMKQKITNYDSDTDSGKNTFVEYITESSDLLSCVRIRLPKLLEKKNISIVIIDSVAAPFRVEHAGYIQRAENLCELATNLITSAQRYNLAILCTNQVTAAIEISSEEVLPSLGLAWSNMICDRLWLKKTHKELSYCIDEELNSKICSNVRELSVKFSPELPHTVAKFIITQNGILSV